MEAGKKAAESAATSAKAGMEETEAALQEKGEKPTASDPADKAAAAEQRKQEKIRNPTTFPGGAAAAGVVRDWPAGGYVEPGVAESRPIGLPTGTGRPSAAHNPHVGSDRPEPRSSTGRGYT